MRHLIWGTASFVLLLGGAAAGSRAAATFLRRGSDRELLFWRFDP